MVIMNVTKVVGGKKVSPKTPKTVHTPKAYFVRELIFQLNAALIRDARVLTKLDQRKEFYIDLQELVEKFTEAVTSVLDSFPTSGNRIPAAFFKKVKSLQKLLQDFIGECQKEITSNDVHSMRIAFAVKWLADDVNHFTTRVEQTYSSVSALFDSSTGQILPPSTENIPNRHRDPNKERIFTDAVKKYQDINGTKKFMPHSFVEAFMKNAGYRLSERAYRLYKSDFLADRFGKLVK
jgi:hypothetical protein